MDREKTGVAGAAWEVEGDHEVTSFANQPSVSASAFDRQIHLADIQLRSEFAANAADRKRGRPELFSTVNGGPSWRDSRDPRSSLILATSRPLITSAGPVGSPAGINQAFGEIGVQTTTRPVAMLDASEMFALFPWNTPDKSRLFQQLKKSIQKVDVAKTQLTNATAQKVGKEGKKLAAAEKAEKSAEKQLALTQKQQAAAETQVRQFLLQNLPRIERADADVTATRQKIAALTQQIKKLKAAKSPLVAAKQTELEQEKVKEGQLHQGFLEKIADTNLQRQSVSQNNYRYTIDGETIKLQDSVEAYCTVSLQGTNGQGLSEADNSVEKALAASNLSASQQKILRAISSSEGGFSSVNTYDKKNITWGFIQWAGADRSALVTTLLSLKEAHPEAFDERFARYGINVDAKSRQLTVTGVDGNVKRGEEAGLAIQNSPILTAVISRAGMDPVVQDLQLHAAASQQIIDPLDQTVTIKGKDASRAIALGEIFTSEYGVGVLADHTVHAGLGKGAIQQDLQAYVTKQNLDPAKVADWAADAEQALIASVISGWTDRAKKLEEQGCSKKAGTFTR